jgi:tetratricopeptide (TPR) repeat protein
MVPIYLVSKLFLSDSTAPSDATPQFVGKASCKECHLPEYNDWLKSDHYKAMAHATDSTVLGDFSGAELEYNGMTHKMYMRDNKYLVYTDGEKGEMQEFEIKYTFGYYPLQQYLVEFDQGRLQTLPLTWDSEDSVWYHMADYVYANETIEHTNWLHWTNQAQNWNSMCADCHSTNLIKGYNHESDSYNTTWSEINVSCEACHGPGSTHVEWANLPEYAREKYTNTGLTVQTSNIDHVQYVDQCMRCHSRRSSLKDYDLMTSSIYNHSIPTLPDEPTWHIDGQILDEDYVYASFTQSKMYMKEVQCNDCHNVHSGQLLFDGNRLCHQCHKADIYDTPDHHFHKSAGMPGEAVTSVAGVRYEVGSGTECINCHMHAQYYMGVDYRNDHSFRIPRPDLSIKHGTPNACNQCHADKPNEWSERYITQWFGKSRRYHFAEAFHAAKGITPEASQDLLRILGDELYPTNIRSLSLQHLGTYYQDTLKNHVGQWLLDLSPTIRLAAVQGVQIQSQKDIQLLLPLLFDETKAVRTQVARLLMGVGNDNIPDKYKDIYAKALKEYEDVLIYNADFPTGKFNLANYYYNQGKNALAEKYYLQTLKQDSELHFVKLNMAYLYNRMGQNDKAEKLFRNYLSHSPDDAQSWYSFGLLLAEMQKYPQALEALEKSDNMQPGRPRVNYNIGMLYDFLKDKTKAEFYLKKEVEVSNDYNTQSELLRFYISNQMTTKAYLLAQELLAKYPAQTELKQVIENLQQNAPLNR